MSAVLTERLVAIAQAAQAARHGERGAIYQAACQELGMSLQTLHRKLNEVSLRPTRKRRADTGKVALTRDEALFFSAYLLEHVRKNDKENKSIKQALAELREHDPTFAVRLDPATGELIPLSESAVSRALRQYGLHPDQVSAPEPVTPLKSRPNLCWQIDASLCVLYKLPDGSNGRIEDVKTTERYKNKLSEFAKIEHRLVQRYLVTDHASCAVFIYYALGGESAENLCTLLALAIQKREGFPFYGIPKQIMLDRASASRSASFRNLCKALSIELIFAQGARAKGQVEKMHDVVERGFESGLKLAVDVRTVEQLNTLGHKWMHWFNGTQKHSRHGMTRYAAWQQIKADQLITTDLTTEQLLLLATETPKSCPVTSYLAVNYKSKVYDVSQIANVQVGDRLDICRSALQADAVHAVLINDDGHEMFVTLPEKRRDELFGFFEDAQEIGAGHGRHADTPAQTARKAMERLAMDAETDSEANAKRKAKAAPFGGAIDPYQAMHNYQHPTYFPNRETRRELAVVQTEEPRLSHVAMMRWLKERGTSVTPTLNQELTAAFPEGATESQMQQLWIDLQAGRTASGKARLQAV